MIEPTLTDGPGGAALLTHYLERAAQARCRAAESEDPDTRKQFLEVARIYEKLAEHAAKLRRDRQEYRGKSWDVVG